MPNIYDSSAEKKTKEEFWLPPQGWRCVLTVSVEQSLLPENTWLECVDSVHQTPHCGCLHGEQTQVILTLNRTLF